MKKNLKNNTVCIVFILLSIFILNLTACSFFNQQSAKSEKVIVSVVEIEKYGHAILDITVTEFAQRGYELGDIVHVSFNSYESDMPYYDGYYSNPGKVMLRGSSPERNIAICINYGDFANETGLKVGDSVEITMVEKAGMLTFQEFCSMQYSYDRSTYPDDATFANFRAVTIGQIGNGKLYRSASPINNEYGRASYANALIESVNIATVLNLADCVEDIENYLVAEDFNSDYYRSLYENGKVIALDMTANFFSDSFTATLVEGLRFLAQNQPPYCVHCTEGKDRAGFTTMVLASLMGASLQEIIDDYMLSFYNYFGIDKESQPEKYEVVLDNNLIAMLYHLTGVNSKEALAQIDLQSSVTEFLLNAGMTEEELLTIKEKLS